MTRTFTELMELETFEERYDYLALRGVVGDVTFGGDRWLNQRFYTSREWRQLRSRIIVRDNGCDLGIFDREVNTSIVIHHMNPMDVGQLVEGDSRILDPEFLISVSHRTHNAIHYGDRDMLPKQLVPRRPGDTKLW